MRLRTATRWMSAVLLGVLAAGVTACTASGSMTVYYGGAGIEFTWNGTDPGRTLDILTTGEGCVHVTFMDKEGEKTGEWEGDVPATDIPVPPGTTDWEAEPCDEDGASATAKGGASSKVLLLRGYEFRGGSLEPDPTAGELDYCVEVFETSLPRARGILKGILSAAQGGSQLRPGGVYRIRHLVETRLVGRDVVMTFADETPFQRLDFDLNGVRNHRTLKDAALVQVPDWHLAVLSVPVADLDHGTVPGQTYRNEFGLRLRNASSPRVVIDGVWEYTL